MSGPTDRPATAGWGRVAADGTVYVRTGNGERPVGQWPGGEPAEVLAFFERRFDALELEVRLLEQRLRDNRLTPDAAVAGLRKARELVREAAAVGDFAALVDRLDGMERRIQEQREIRKAHRAAQLERARSRKELLAAEAEALAAGSDWRTGANRLRELLAEWKTLPRLEKSVDEDLWRRFSTARTTYTRRRKQHFAKLAERHATAAETKSQLAAEAESLAESTDWGPTSARLRALMQAWKAAGPAGKADEALWARFRAAQDRFFTNRDAVNAQRDQEYATNAERKEALLRQAEALLPVTDARAAKEAFRDVAARWDQVAKVPRAQVKSFEARFRAVEEAIRSADDDRRKRGNPAARARAEDTITQLEGLIGKLEIQLDAERADGGSRVRELEESLTARRAWLDQALRARDDFASA